MRTSKRSILYWSCVATTTVATVLAACSKEGGELEELAPGAGRPPSSTETGGQFGSSLPPGSGSSASNGSDTPLVIGPQGTGGASSNISPTEKCGGEVSKATLTPVNMFIQFDRSTSMRDNNKWTQAAAALDAFFQDPEGDGLKVALHFFPSDDPAPGCKGLLRFGGGQQIGGGQQQFGGQQQSGTGGASGAPVPGTAGSGAGSDLTCVASACAVPLVPLGPLLRDPAPTDTQEAKLVQAVIDSAPDEEGSGGTPLLPALQGALDWAKANQAATPGEKTVIVLVTDGEPTVCCGTTTGGGFATCPAGHINEITAVATEGANLGIQTYVIGIQGASQQQVNAIARAGGTEKAYFAGNAATAQTDLIEALKAIRGSALECQFAVPETTAGTTFDKGKVNIQFTSGASAEPEVLRKAAQGCAAGGDWVYDNESAPTSISLCESTCTRIKEAPGAQLEVQVGCSTVPF